VATLANAHFVDSDINGSTSAAVTDWDNSTYSEQKRAIAHPTNWAHIEGQTVDVLDDGVATTGTITSGALVPVLTGTLHIGLNFESTVKPSKLDLEGMGLVITKKITKAIVSFFNTLMGKVGTASGNMETVSFGSTLFTGIKPVPINGGYEREGDIIILQDKPLPMITRGLVLDLGAHNK
jgi:hypothetical protein